MQRLSSCAPLLLRSGPRAAAGLLARHHCFHASTNDQPRTRNETWMRTCCTRTNLWHPCLSRLLLNPTRWIILAEIAPPPNIRTGPERVLEPNVRWGARHDTCGAIHLLGLRVKSNFNIPMDSTKAVARRTLHMSVCMTASQYYALATSPLGEPIAQVVRYGPCGTHGIVFRPSLDVVRSRFAKNTLAAPNARRGRARG